jgi:hypothetical protein
MVFVYCGSGSGDFTVGRVICCLVLVISLEEYVVLTSSSLSRKSSISLNSRIVSQGNVPTEALSEAAKIIE